MRLLGAGLLAAFCGVASCQVSAERGAAEPPPVAAEAPKAHDDFRQSLRDGCATEQECSGLYSEAYARRADCLNAGRQCIGEVTDAKTAKALLDAKEKEREVKDLARSAEANEEFKKSVARSEQKAADRQAESDRSFRLSIWRTELRKRCLTDWDIATCDDATVDATAEDRVSCHQDCPKWIEEGVARALEQALDTCVDRYAELNGKGSFACNMSGPPAGADRVASLQARCDKACVDGGKKRRTWAQKTAPCCDGTVSPVCKCGNLYDGCCWRHGGVCGCD